MMDQPLMSVKDVGVQFKYRSSMMSSTTFDALKNISFDIYKGDSVGIIGRNGSGKTTLLRLLGGIIKPDHGSIFMKDISTALLALQIGFDLELTGRLNALISGMLLGFTQKEVLANMDKIIEFAELENFIDKPTRVYSAGMKARLGFAVTLEMCPDVLLIDEVLGVGDANFQKKSMAVMKKKILSEQTIVFVSHNALNVKLLCNKAVWIENGIVQMKGDSAKIVAAYEEFLKAL
jgi:lipopolysaccharide transport system ATP-binding protein